MGTCVLPVLKDVYMVSWTVIKTAMDNFEIFRWVLKACELLAALTGFLCWHKWKGSFWKWFSFYFLFIVTAELTGMYLRDNISHQANNLFYSFIVRPVSFLFFFWVFYRYDSINGIRNKISGCLALIYAGCLAGDYLYFQHQKFWIQSFSFSAGTVLLLILLIRFFINFVFKSDILQYSRNMMFWFSFSLFLYYLGTFPFFALRNTLAANYPSVFTGYWYVQMSLSCLMYLLLSFSFIWAKPKL